MLDEREYKLYLHKIDPDPLGFYKADFVGKGNGHISTGAMVFSNTTSGLGNLTGYIHPQKVAVFQLVDKQNVFVSTDGCQMTFQNIIGKNDLTYIQGFIEYILQRKLQSIQGDEYQGLNMKKAYIVKFKYEDGMEGNATMTNGWPKLKLTGKTREVTIGGKKVTIYQYKNFLNFKFWYDVNGYEVKKKGGNWVKGTPWWHH